MVAVKLVVGEPESLCWDNVVTEGSGIVENSTGSEIYTCFQYVQGTQSSCGRRRLAGQHFEVGQGISGTRTAAALASHS